MGFGRFSLWLRGAGKRSDTNGGKGRKGWEHQQQQQQQKKKVEEEEEEEGNFVVVTVDGRCLVGLGFDDSDWSIGWVERHHPDFHAADESGFAVLVPFYEKGVEQQQRCHVEDSYKAQLLAAISIPEDKKYLEELLSSDRVD